MATTDIVWSAFIAAAAALGSSLGTYFVTRRSVVAQAKIDHDGRHFERRADTYLRLNQLLLKSEAWLSRLDASMTGKPTARKVATTGRPAADDDFVDMLAYTRTFASPTVSAKLADLREGVRTLTALAWDQTTTQPKALAGDELADARTQIAAVRTAIRELATLTNAELVSVS